MGEAVGIAVGESVGVNVGDSVGTDVGDSEGCDVGISKIPRNCESKHSQVNGVDFFMSKV